ncbi:MAG: transglycosylase SLT domain-containing protein [Aquificae bacterium]|nr:transglycosylase SLT domain-containing protein [Aquificota bacterium]
MKKRGWLISFIFLIPAFLFSCSSKSHYSSIDYKALPPKVKIKKSDDYEEVVVYRSSKYRQYQPLNKEEYIYIKRKSKKLGMRINEDTDIRRFLYFYAVRNKSYVKKVLERANLYIPMIKSVFKKQGLPEDLAYLPFIESGFDPYATSISGAAGLWQFVKGTGKRFGLEINEYVDERRDPYKSTIAAARYLKYLYKMFGRWDLAIAAYNCGEGCVLDRISKKTDDFWDIKDKLPQQTREYVPRFIAALLIVKNPQRYGIYVKPKNIKLKKKVARVDTSLKKLSYIYDIDYHLLKLYNAHFQKEIVIRGYNIYIPTEGSLGFTPQIRKVSYKRKVYINHVVKKGETLYRIAKKYNISIEEIKKLNNIVGNNIKVGQVLKIPKEKYAYRYEIE